MTDIPTPEPRTWDVEDPDITAEEFLVGCCEQRWVGDEQSQMDATGVLLGAVFMAAGLSLDEALDVVERHVDRGVTVSLTEEGLQFEFAGEEEADEEAETAPDDDPDTYDTARQAYDAAIESGLTHDEAVGAAWPEGPEGP